MSEKLTQLTSRLRQFLDKILTMSRQAAVRAWHMAKQLTYRLRRSLFIFSSKLRNRWPGWKNIFSKTHRKIKPVRPDLPAVKSETAIAAKARPRKKKPIRRHGRQRVYRLKGFTTVAKVNRKHKSEFQQSLLRKALIFIAILLVLILLYSLYNPFNNTDLDEWYRIIGINEWSDLFKDNPLLPDLTPTPEAP